MKYIFNSYFKKEEKGAWNGRRYDINTSSILTRLIQEAGRVCKYYASDLFYEWREVEKSLEKLGDGEEEFVFGFHTNGVHDKNDLANMARDKGGTVSPGNSHLYSIYVLTVIKDGRDIKMVLKDAMSCSND